ncbi:YbiU family protein [Marinomonas algicola]|uniref:YbiU family protein n=1 Tax=Marinomonas algicola TaxID=2773454 RepID=UPI0019D55B0B|nr:YbiU family protein [Marinomonas algicola]
MMSNSQIKNTLPEDVVEAVLATKNYWKQSIGDVSGLMDRIIAHLEMEIDTIEAELKAGMNPWPEVDYKSIETNSVSLEVLSRIKKRGCLVVRQHFSEEMATQWDQDLVSYIEDNDFDNQYRGPGDDFFSTLSASRPEIFPIYWSKPQMEANQSKRMQQVQVFLNGFWKAESAGKVWFDPKVNCIYPDRVRRRPPGTTSNGLGPHTDSGALERWLLPAYQKVFRHLLNGDFDLYDPWDAAYRPEVNEYESGTTKCSAFRTFQGWTALSDIKQDQGVLFTVPVPSAMAYLLIRPLLDDVPEESLCGVSPRKVLPIDKKWHSLLLRAKALIPDLQAGDSVWWHCDMIHGVDPVENQQGWGNVMYIPATPSCEKNRRYARQCAEYFKLGRSPDDFPEEHYEADWQGRFQWDDLNAIGKAAFNSD